MCMVNGIGTVYCIGPFWLELSIFALQKIRHLGGMCEFAFIYIIAPVSRQKVKIIQTFIMTFASIFFSFFFPLLP